MNLEKAGVVRGCCLSIAQQEKQQQQMFSAHSLDFVEPPQGSSGQMVQSLLWTSAAPSGFLTRVLLQFAVS